MSKTVLQSFGLDPTQGRDVPKGIQTPVLPDEYLNNSDVLVGIEVEVENLQLENGPSKVWNQHGDGSLRNNGAEFVTVPIQARYAPYALRNLLEAALSKECCFSPRTSIHVHLNMQPYNTEQVKNIVLLYSCFEPLFFRFAGRGRMKNIYCVPLTETMLLHSFEKTPLSTGAPRWLKYTGLNLLTLGTLGTIEARHMHGTFDVKKLSIWVRLWTDLIEYCLKKDISEVRKMIAGFSSRTEYPKVLYEIFGRDVQFMKFREFSDIETSVMTTKTAFTSGRVTDQLLATRSLESAPYFKFKVK